MRAIIRPFLALVLIGYLVCVYGFSWDPVGLILKRQDKASQALAAARARGRATNAEELKALFKNFAKPGTLLDDIEDSFRTHAEYLGTVYKQTMMIGEGKFYHYRFRLKYGVTAYVLGETYIRKVAQHGRPVQFDEPH